VLEVVWTILKMCLVVMREESGLRAFELKKSEEEEGKRRNDDLGFLLTPSPRVAPLSSVRVRERQCPTDQHEDKAEELRLFPHDVTFRRVRSSVKA
jgi:hypothetical protein